MIGRKISTAISMTNSVSWLDESSHTVRLALGSDDDGRMNGNIASPGVAMMPSKPRALARNAPSGLRRASSKAGSNGPARPGSGGIHGQGGGGRVGNQGPHRSPPALLR